MAISEIKDALTNPNVFFLRGLCVFKSKKCGVVAIRKPKQMLVSWPANLVSWPADLGIWVADLVIWRTDFVMWLADLVIWPAGLVI